MKCAFYLALVLMGSMAACSNMVVSSDASPSVPWTRPLLESDTESLLIYYEWAHKLPAAQLVREYGSVHRTFIRYGSDFDRLRCAILLGVPGTPINDLSGSLELLEPVAKNPAASLHTIAFLLQSQLSEQRRLDASATELQQKLNALKSLEKNMSGHEASDK
jgi:hypothetical protein